MTSPSNMFLVMSEFPWFDLKNSHNLVEYSPLTPAEGAVCCVPSKDARFPTSLIFGSTLWVFWVTAKHAWTLFLVEFHAGFDCIIGNDFEGVLRREQVFVLIDGCIVLKHASCVVI